MKRLYEDFYNCTSWEQSANNSCHKYADYKLSNVCDIPIEFIRKGAGFSSEELMSYNVIYFYAKAFDQIIRGKCRGAKNKEELRKCITTEDVINELRGSEYVGPGDFLIKLDNNGDAMGNLRLYQFQGEGRKLVAIYQEYLESPLTIFPEDMKWDMFKEDALFTTLNHNSSSYTVPDVVCSKPCPPRHYYVQQVRRHQQIKMQFSYLHFKHPKMLCTSDDLSQLNFFLESNRKKFDCESSSEVHKMLGYLKCKYENCIVICRCL